MSPKYQPQPTGIDLVAKYFILYFTAAFVVLFSAYLFPSHIVLGTHYISKSWALVFSLGLLSLIHTFAIPFVRLHENSRQRPLSSGDWKLFHFFINLAGLWFISRLAHQLGLGISGWIVIVGLSFVLVIFQGLALMQLEKWRQQL